MISYGDLWSIISGVWGYIWCNHIRQVGPHPQIPENWPQTQAVIRLRVVPYTLSQLINMQKHWICEAVQVGFEAHLWWYHIRQVGSLPPKLPKIHPTFMWDSIRLRVVPYTHSQLIKVVTTFDMYDMFLWSSPSGVWGSSMMIPHQTGWSLPQDSRTIWP